MFRDECGLAVGLCVEEKKPAPLLLFDVWTSKTFGMHRAKPDLCRRAFALGSILAAARSPSLPVTTNAKARKKRARVARGCLARF